MPTCTFHTIHDWSLYITCNGVGVQKMYFHISSIKKSWLEKWFTVETGGNLFFFTHHFVSNTDKLTKFVDDLVLNFRHRLNTVNPTVNSDKIDTTNPLIELLAPKTCLSIYVKVYLPVMLLYYVYKFHTSQITLTLTYFYL